MIHSLLEADTGVAVDAGIDWNALWNTIVSWCTSTGIKLLIAIALMIISFKLIDVITKKIYKKLQTKHADETLARMGTKITRIILKTLILITLVGYVGIETASISALIASIGVGISLAVQGTLSNFAGGVIITLMRPFRIGDFITSNGESGTVEDIKLFYTTIVTPDNKAISIPNGTLANNVIVNASAKDTRRVDLLFSVAYGSDVDKVKSIIREVCANYELVHTDPAPFIEMTALASSSLDFVVRVWCNRVDYWTVNFYLIDAVKKALDANGIEIPFNQLDVNLKKPKDELPAPQPEQTEN